MDLHTIETLIRLRSRADLPEWQDGDAWLAGGTWLYSEPQPALRRLIDLTTLGWAPHEVGRKSLTLSATCTVAALERLELPGSWIAAPLVGQCCRALLGSFKVWNGATVGGNLCLALPAGPIIALAAALEGECLLWAPDGGERRLPVTEFVRGPQSTALAPGEIMRSLTLPPPSDAPCASPSRTCRTRTHSSRRSQRRSPPTCTTTMSTAARIGGGM